MKVMESSNDNECIRNRNDPHDRMINIFRESQNWRRYNINNFKQEFFLNDNNYWEWLIDIFCI
jgi:hypothetical protein